MIVDWLETNETNEKKLAHKTFPDGRVQILLIEKVTKDGARTATKEPISEEEYAKLKQDSQLCVEKTRYEFNYDQNGVNFAIKYDEFTGSTLHMLEVDAQSEEDRAAFIPEDFPRKLQEVTGQVQYYGYRVSTVL